MRSVETVLALVVLGTLVAALAGRLRAPAPTLLVVAGLLVGLLPGVPTVQVTPDIIGLVVLPPLLYAASEELPWRDVRAVWRPVATLAVGLVAVSAAAVGLVAAAVSPLSGRMAFVLGAVLASTDPVAVTALGRRLPLPARVQALVSAESLFNDATSLVLFRVAVSVAVAGGALGWGHTLGEFVLLAGGGLVTGVVAGTALVLVRRRVDDPVLETVIALVTPYAVYVLAEAAHGAGVTAVVVAGLILGSRSERMTTGRIRLQLHAVYGTVVFLLESVVFSLIGLELPALVDAVDGGGAGWVWQALAVTATLMVVRVVWVFALWAVTRSRQPDQVSWRVPAVVTWAGTRGVLPLAAALSIPLHTDAGGRLPQRDLVLLLTTSVIVVTLVVQGMTLAPVVRWSGIALGPEHVRGETSRAQLRLARAGLAYLDNLPDEVPEEAPVATVERIRRDLEAAVDSARQRLADDRYPATTPTEEAYRRLRREVIGAQAAELARMFQDGEISDGTRRTLQRRLDLEEARLHGG
ncbi:MAG: Na+/H+ antiporter [Mycobacteriales bacterium]